MARQLWRTVHRWSGIALAIPLLVAGLTGALISFHHEIDRWLLPEYLVVEPRERVLSLDEALASLDRYGAKPGFVHVPQAADNALAVDLEEPVIVHGEQWTTVFIDPYRGEVLGGRDESGWRFDRVHAIPLLYRLHFTLGAGEIGTWIMGIAAALWAVSAIVGLTLAVPRVRLLPRALKIRRAGKPIAIAYDWHRSLGVATLALTAVVAFSGFYLALPAPLDDAMHAAGLRRHDPRKALPVSAAYDSDRPIGWAAAVERAQLAAPQARPYGVAMDEERGYYQVRMIDPDDVLVRGTRRVMVDAGSGAVVVNWSQLGSTAAEKFTGWQFPLHSGQAFGEFGRWLASVLSIVVVVLVIAGLTVFVLRKKPRAARRDSRIAAY